MSNTFVMLRWRALRKLGHLEVWVLAGLGSTLSQDGNAGQGLFSHGACIGMDRAVAANLGFPVQCLRLWMRKWEADGLRLFEGDLAVKASSALSNQSRQRAPTSLGPNLVELCPLPSLGIRDLALEARFMEGVQARLVARAAPWGVLHTGTSSLARAQAIVSLGACEGGLGAPMGYVLVQRAHSMVFDGGRCDW